MRLPVVVVGLVIVASVSAWYTTGAPSQPGKTITYFIAADEIDWDYAPSNKDLVMGHPLDTTEFEFAHGPKVAPRVFRKAIYREYTDSTFVTLKPRPPEWEHLGIVGPVLRAQVGDTIRVTFRNNGQYPFSMHPHGVFYTKNSEGAPYDDGTAQTAKLDDAVPPRGSHTYLWPVPERAGPGPNDLSSMIWVYHSHTHEWRDINAGLLGPIIVTRRGRAGADGRPVDVDREIVTLFGVFNENDSRYTTDNLRRYTGDTLRAGPDGDYTFSGVGMQTINGYTYGNLPISTMRMVQGERVRWYLFNATVADDFHAPHWHGGTLLLDGKRVDVANMAVPLYMTAGDMVPDAPGIWMLHCHVAEHTAAGMTARFEVVTR